MPHLLLHLAALASGAAALACQVLWVRRLGEIFGQTTPAVATVLSVFFLGLGLGAWLFGRLASSRARALRLLVALELAIALCGLAFLPASSALERAYVAWAPAEWPLGRALLVKGLLSAVLLLPPATAMGGTLPALVQAACARASELGTRLARIYALNTLGGAAGALAVAFVLLPRLGLEVSMRCAAATNVIAAGCVLLAARRILRGEVVTAPSITDAPRAAPPRAPLARGLLVAAALSGFLSVACEVLWTRALAARTTSTVYSYAIVLAVYLAALAVGAWALSALDRRGLASRSMAGLTLSAAGLAVVASIAVLARMPSLEVAYPRATLEELLVRELGWATIAIAPAAACFGLALPLIARLAHGRGDDVGHTLGRTWLANTLGTVVAPLVAGFVLLPALELRASLVLIGALALIAGLALTWPSRSRRTAIGAIAAAAAIALALPTDLRLWRTDPRDRLVAYREGLEASLAVVDEASGDRSLRLNYGYRLGSVRTRFAQERQGLIPLALHARASSVLVLGLGTGSSGGALSKSSGLSVDLLEIVPELGELLPWFRAANHDLATRLAPGSGVRLLAVDGRHFVRTTPRRYDLVVGDLFVPWRAGEGAMFTREHFASVRRTLAPGGLFCQWLPLYQLAPRELATIAATLCDVFPHVSAFWLYFNVEQPALGLMAGDTPLAVDPHAMAELAGSSPVRTRLFEEAGLSDPEFTVGSFVAGEGTLRRLLPEAQVESSAHPRIEYDAPRSRFASSSPLAEQCVRLLLEKQEDLGTAVVARALGAAERERCAEKQRAVASWFRGACLARYSGDTPGALREYVRALSFVPGWSWIVLNVAERCDQLVRSGSEGELRAAIEILREPPSGTRWPRDFAQELTGALAQRAPARR